jgi:hypothetical protein
MDIHDEIVEPPRRKDAKEEKLAAKNTEEVTKIIFAL